MTYDGSSSAIPGHAETVEYCGVWRISAPRRTVTDDSGSHVTDQKMSGWRNSVSNVSCGEAEFHVSTERSRSGISPGFQPRY